MAMRFNSPPNWSTPQAGWTPPAGWSPPAEWGAAPDDWQFWVEDGPLAALPVSQPTREPIRKRHSAAPLTSMPGTALAQQQETVDLNGSGQDTRVPLFGARGRARELAAELTALRAHMADLGALDVAQLQEMKAELINQNEQLRAQAEHDRGTFATELES